MACGPGDVPFEEPVELICPRPEWVPTDGSWQQPANRDFAAANGRVKHAAMDMVGLPDGLGFRTDFANDAPGALGVIDWTGTAAMGPPDQGFVSQALPGERVSMWFYDGGWSGTDPVETNGGGQYVLPGPSSTAGLTERVMILEADGSCGMQVSMRLPSASPVVITDIDGTLTISDDELFDQVSDAAYDPVAYDGAVELMQLWAEKGVQPIYMTARPHGLRTETRAWLQAHGYPPGPLISSNDLVFGGAAAVYKLAWVQRLRTELGWDVVAAYGNADTDITAYLDGGIDPARVFIIGENAGAQGTVAVHGDWLGHIDAVVRAF